MQYNWSILNLAPFLKHLPFNKAKFSVIETVNEFSPIPQARHQA